ncbi:hypothetical protein BO79DRAFT_230115 [Aspergillus costaricaensis CBS 115574]|uniref:Uncharacterized protein n=1 Tax=Aspergillus costaricaensis CBS 115574 TaxID=1448317 RepID=A0ACD1I9G2_9EURO|nr:hypothetical protein BO79DRAFT_230115 [Aspergillus costaricaensis CBS 115574]RAK86908.1 hypothetical protein BO79DRAFT_230115 [Aspergillus costaricaensis CBS 115574]
MGERVEGKEDKRRRSRPRCSWPFQILCVSVAGVVQVPGIANLWAVIGSRCLGSNPMRQDGVPQARVSQGLTALGRSRAAQPLRPTRATSRTMPLVLS